MAEAKEESSVGLKRLCVIGAGPSGLSVLHAFAEAASKGETVPEIVCFEKQADWGGQWNFSAQPGTDEFGEPIHSAMYSNLWSNGPKEGLEYPDYSFEEHFGKIIGSYPPRSVLADYIVGRAKKSGFRDQISFSTAVRMVEKDDDRFRVTVEDLKKGQVSHSLFDYVIVAVGHFWSPHLPRLPGIASFPGRVIHARDFRRAEQFAGQDVCLIGASYSAEDLACQLLKFGAKSVTCSYRSSPMKLVNPPEGFSERPEITKVSGSQLTFQDGSTAEVNAVIYCTGYEYRFPMLHSSLRIESKLNTIWASSLYKGTVFVNDPKLFYLGMQDQWYTFSMFDAEAWFIRDVIQGSIKTPTQETMLKDMKEWSDKCKAVETEMQSLQFQHDYVADLISHVPSFPKYDVTGAMNEFVIWKRAKKTAGILAFRDTEHTSVVTGNKQGKHHTSWWEATDDSLECYLK